MINPDELLKKIDALTIFGKNGESQRGYLGASEIGDQCARKLWLSFNNYVKPQQFDGRLFRLFFRGKREEPVLETILEECGFKIVQSCLDQAGFKDGFFAGHGDGIYEYEGQRIAIEYKTHSLKQFETLERGQLRQTHPKHYAQCIVYQHKFNCAYALYVAVCKDDDRIFIDAIEPNADHYKEYCDKAEFITMADKPPERIASKVTDYRCKFCHARDVCFGMALPRVDCRNCTSVAKDRQGGTFYCEKPDRKKQLDSSGACAHHSFNPFAAQDLLGWNPVEFFPKDRAVKYKKQDGDEIINGYKYIQSKDLKL